MTASTPKMWRSKLGNDFDMAEVVRNDARTKQELDRLRHLPENRYCADCGQKPTVWASVNLGVFLCLTCGSHHRAIGTHISAPKGCTGTYYWATDELARMKSIGNRRAGETYGATRSDERPSPSASDGIWRQFLVQKYEQLRFAPQPRQAEANPIHRADEFRASASNRSIRPKLLGLRRQPAATTNNIAQAQHDLISFNDVEVPNRAAFPVASVAQQNDQQPDFFAEFGL